MVDQIRFFATAARHLEGKSAGEYMAGHTSFIRREPVGVCAQVAPVELPDDDGGVEVRPGDRRRQHRRAQAERHDAGEHDAARRDRRRVPAARRVQRHLRRPRHRPGDGRPRRSPTWCRSPARCAPAWRSPARRPPTSSGSTSSSAARRRSSCSTTPTSTPPSRAISVAGYFNAGQDCTAATRVLAGPGVYGDFADALAEAAKGTQDRPARRRGRAVRPGQQRRPAGAGDAASSTARPTTPACSPAAARQGDDAATSTSRPSSPTCSRTTR